MRHLGMIDDANVRISTSNIEARMTNDGAQPWLQQKHLRADTAVSTLLTKFEWLYTKSTGVWYPKVAPGDAVREGEQIGTVGDLFGDTLEEIVSPVNGVVLFLTINPSVLEKGLLMGIGAD